MDVDEELVDYQEDEEMMALDGGVPKPVAPPATGEDADAMMTEDDAAMASAAPPVVMTDGDDVMRIEEEPATVIPQHGDEAMMDDAHPHPAEEDAAMVDEDHHSHAAMDDAATSGGVVSDSEGAPLAMPIDTNLPDPIPITPIVPTAPPDGMPITGADVSSAPAPSWPPGPEAIPPVPSRLPDATSVPERLMHEEGKLDAGTGTDPEITSIRAEPPASPSKTIVPMAAEMEAEAGPVEGGEVLEDMPPAEVVEEVTVATEFVESVPVAAEEAAAVEKVNDEATGAPAEAEPAHADEAAAIGTPVAEESHYEEPEHDENAEEDGEAEPAAVNEDGEEDQDLTEEYDEAALGDGEAENGEGKDIDEQEDSIDSYDDQALPLILIALNEFDRRPLFDAFTEEAVDEFNAAHPPTAAAGADGADAGADNPAQPSQSLKNEAVLPSMGDDLFKVPMSELFVALRVGLSGVLSDDPGFELVLSEKDLGLKIGEDNRHADQLTLCDLVDLHRRCNCPEPITLFVEYESTRFIAKYNAIKKVLDAAEGKIEDLAQDAAEYAENGVDEFEHDEEYGEGEEEEGEQYQQEAEGDAHGPAPGDELAHEIAGDVVDAAEEVYEDAADEDQETYEDAEEGAEDGEGRAEQVPTSEDSGVAVDNAASGMTETTSGAAETEPTTDREGVDTSAADADAESPDAYGIDGIIRGAEDHAETNGHNDAEAVVAEPESVVADELIDYEEDAAPRTPTQLGKEPSGTKRSLEEDDSPTRQVKRKLSENEGDEVETA